MSPRATSSGGFSESAKITVYFDTYFAVATHMGDNVNGCSINCINEIRSESAENPGWKRSLISTLKFLGLSIISVGLPEFFGIPLWLQWFVIGSVFAVALYRVGRRVGKEHGAEHMAIQAYMQENSYDLEIILRMDRIDNSCGGRFSAIYIVAWILAPLLSIVSGWPAFILWSYLVVGGFFLDFISNGKVPIFVFISRLIQKYLTTKKPDECALRTAQKAIKCFKDHSFHKNPL